MSRWGERLLWPATIGLSLAAHGAGALMLMQTPAKAPTHEGEVAAPPVVIMLTAAPMLEPEPLPEPEPEPEPVKETPLKAAEEPAPKQVDVERPKPEKKREKREKKPEKKREKTPEARKKAEPAPSAAATAKKASKGGNKAWASKVRSKIEKRKRFPAGGTAGSVGLSISISAAGALNSVAVSASSGQPALDRAALEAVRRAAPFPPAPEGGGPFNIRVTMSFKRR